VNAEHVAEPSPEDAAPPASVPLLEVRDLAVTAGGRRLLESSSCALQEGQRVLVVGPSGGGKSLFLDLLLGFAGPESAGLEVEGAIRLEGEDMLGRPPAARDHRVGAVFQLHASGLFDDLTVMQNLRFGDLERERCGAVAGAVGLSTLDRRAVRCSGGERIRVVLARTLLRGAGVLVYDEPTTGLDPGAARQVVSAIEASHQRLTIIITHDYASFAAFADRVLFLDPVTRRFLDLPGGPETVARLRSVLQTPAAPAPEAPPRVLGWKARWRKAWGRAADTAADTLQDALTALAAPAAWLRASTPLDGPRVRQSLARHLAPGVAAFVGTSAVLVALTATYFLFDRLPKRPYAEPLFLDDLLAGLGIILCRVAIPLVVSVLLAAKLGASTAAHLGHMSYTRQIDALRLLGIPLRRRAHRAGARRGVRHVPPRLPVGTPRLVRALLPDGLDEGDRRGGRALGRGEGGRLRARGLGRGVSRGYGAEAGARGRRPRHPRHAAQGASARPRHPRGVRVRGVPVGAGGTEASGINDRRRGSSARACTPCRRRTNPRPSGTAGR
jgi:energy-coupling factor transporter ATP-binding protein EcfA2